LDTKPELEDYEWIWDAYTRLTTCRQITSGGIGPIPWTAINDYATRHALNETEFMLVEAGVMALDVEYLTKIKDDSEKANKATRTKTHGSRNTHNPSRSRRK
jgi:hypothetical protein